MCKNCISVNWEDKSHCRSCGLSLADSMPVTPRQWPPNIVNRSRDQDESSARSAISSPQAGRTGRRASATSGSSPGVSA
eukprot:1905844-Amphidinium_carterae.1